MVFGSLRVACGKTGAWSVGKNKKRAFTSLAMISTISSSLRVPCKKAGACERESGQGFGGQGVGFRRQQMERGHASESETEGTRERETDRPDIR